MDQHPPRILDGVQTLYEHICVVPAGAVPNEVQWCCRTVGFGYDICPQVRCHRYVERGNMEEIHTRELAC